MPIDPSAQPRRAMILAAGRGSRLAPITDTTPKPLLEVAGEPLLFRHLRSLRAAGIVDVVINVNHLANQIIDAVGDGSRFGLRIQISKERELLETGGGIFNALPLLGSTPFVLLLGDILCDFPLANLPGELAADTDMHMVLTPTPAFRDSGDFEADETRVLSRGDAYVYTGIALVHPNMFANQTLRCFSFRDLFFPAVAAGRVSCQHYHGPWTDIGTPDQLEEARRRYQNITELG